MSIKENYRNSYQSYFDIARINITTYKITQSTVKWIGIILLLIFNRCYKEPLDYNVNVYNPQFVIECYLTNFTNFSMRISCNNRPDNKATLIPITDANVTLYEDNQIIGHPIHDSAGFYSLDFFPSNYHTYKLVVSHPNFNTAEAFVYIPGPIDFNIDTTIIKDLSNQRFSQFKIDIIPSLFKRFYALTLSYNYYKHSLCNNTTKIHRITSFITNKPEGIEFVSRWHDKFSLQNIRFELFSRERSGTGYIAFTNNKILQSNQITLETHYDNFNTTNTVIIYDLSEDVYKHFFSRAIYYQQTSSSLTSPFYTPTSIYGNIKNGLGILGYIFLYEKNISDIPIVDDYCL